MREAYEKLVKLYASKAPREEKLVEKAKITGKLRSDLEMKRAVTNATLIQYKTYGSGKEELAQLFAACGSSFPRMLKSLERLRAASAASPPHTDPALLLRPLLAGGC